MAEAKLLTERKFLTIVDSFAGYCQVCHESRLVGRIAVAGWEYHGTICSQCLNDLADEVQRRGKGLGVEKVGKTSSDGDVLAAIVGVNGYAGEPVRR
jgi:hypothetical protein